MSPLTRLHDARTALPRILRSFLNSPLPICYMHRKPQFVHNISP